MSESERPKYPECTVLKIQIPARTEKHLYVKFDESIADWRIRKLDAPYFGRTHVFIYECSPDGRGKAVLIKHGEWFCPETGAVLSSKPTEADFVFVPGVKGSFEDGDR